MKDRTPNELHIGSRAWERSRCIIRQKKAYLENGTFAKGGPAAPPAMTCGRSSAWSIKMCFFSSSAVAALLHCCLLSVRWRNCLVMKNRRLNHNGSWTHQYRPSSAGPYSIIASLPLIFILTLIRLSRHEDSEGDDYVDNRRDIITFLLKLKAKLSMCTWCMWLEI